MDLNKHIVTDKNNSTFHSSGFARVAGGDRIGSTSTVSFNQRLQIDKNRQLVNGYERSAIANSRGVLRAKTFNRDAAKSNIRGFADRSLQQSNSAGSSSIPHHFSEPTSRGYNPYS